MSPLLHSSANFFIENLADDVPESIHNILCLAKSALHRKIKSQRMLLIPLQIIEAINMIYRERKRTTVHFQMRKWTAASGEYS